LQFLIVIVVLLLLMWVLMVRPQRRKQMQQRSLLENVADGDEILTAGGVYGTVRGVEDDLVRVEIAPGTEIRVAKRAIAAVIPPDEPDEEDEEDEQIEELETTNEKAVRTAASKSDAEKRR
jgi:preprotein translocase subunit YajC